MGTATDPFRTAETEGMSQRRLHALSSNERGGAQYDRMESRRELRETFNQRELMMEELFMNYDHDGSGYLEINELRHLLRDQKDGVEPSDDEIDWILQIACKKDKGARKIRKEELLVAMRSWEGYQQLPDDLMRMFDQFDVNGDGFLEIHEFQSFLSNFAGHKVSKFEAEEVLETADLLSDGKIGRYELLGAVGAWYISVGREPSAPMAIAFAANNRTVSRFHKILHVFIAATLVPTAYFPFAGAYYSKDCKTEYHLTSLLWADGILWFILTVVILAKVHWVQMLNSCRAGPKQISASLLIRTAWVLISSEVLSVMVLVVVESCGLYWALIEKNSMTEEEEKALNEGVKTPWDAIASMKTLSFKRYPSFLEFCEKWFTFNLAFNAVCLLFYYACIAYRAWQLYRHDQSLCAEGKDEGTLRNTLADAPGFEAYKPKDDDWRLFSCCRRTPRSVAPQEITMSRDDRYGA